MFWWEKPLDIETCTVIHVEQLLPEHLIRLAVDTCNPEQAPYWWRPVPKEIHQRHWDFHWMEKLWNMRKFKVTSTSHLIPAHLRKVVCHTMAEPKVADWYRPAVNEAHPSE